MGFRPCTPTPITWTGLSVNPPSVGSVAPATPNANDLWIDDSGTSDVLKTWTGSAWRKVVGTPTDIGLSIYIAEKEGITGDGETDDTVAWNNLFVKVALAGGGDIYLTGGMHSICLGALVPMPYVSRLMSTSGSLHIFGAGGMTGPAGWGHQGASILDLRYDGQDGLHPAKIDCRGAGTLEIDHLSVVSGGADDWPIIQTTNTVLKIHDTYISGNLAHWGSAHNVVQDGIILGGSTIASDGSATASFQGYGTVIRDNTFDSLRTCVYCGVYSEALIDGNIITQQCGGDATHATFEFHAGVGNNTRGNVISNNRMAALSYVYCMRFVGGGCMNNVGIANRFWDYGDQFLGMMNESDSASFNIMLGSIDESYSGMPAPNTSFGLTTRGGTGAWEFIGPTLHGYTPLMAVHPTGYLPEAGASMFAVTRAFIEPTSPNGEIFAVMYNGNVNVSGVLTMQAGKWFGLGTGCGFYDLNGNLTAQAITDNNVIQATRGLFKDRTLATTARPAAATVGAGTTYYDTTLNKPAWSDGTNWRDAAGNIV